MVSFCREIRGSIRLRSGETHRRVSRRKLVWFQTILFAETRILFSFFSAEDSHPGSPHVYGGEGKDLEWDWKCRVPLESHPGLQVFRP
jgi:hypothetical protein